MENLELNNNVENNANVANVAALGSKENPIYTKGVNEPSKLTSTMAKVGTGMTIASAGVSLSLGIISLASFIGEKHREHKAARAAKKAEEEAKKLEQKQVKVVTAEEAVYDTVTGEKL